MTRVLFVSRSLVGPQYHGGCVYPDAILQFLAGRGCEISYLWLAEPLSGERPIMKAPRPGGYVKTLHVPGAINTGGWLVSRRLSDWLSVAGYLGRKLQQKLGLLVAAPAAEERGALATPAEARFVRDVVEEMKPDAVIVDFAETADVLAWGELSVQPLKLVLTHNVVHERVAAYRQRGMPLDFLPMTREQETRLLAHTDVVVAIQDAEAAELREMLPQTRIVVAPMPAQPRPLPTSRQVEGRCFFVGGATQHNIDGLRWFLEEVWPKILGEVPGASLTVCGTVGASFPGSHPRCHFHGSVADLASYYEEAMLAIVPLRAGSGLKIKLIEAMTFSRSIVSTGVGVEGLAELQAGRVMPVADDACGFASAVSSLLKDRDRREQVAARQTDWIRVHLGPDQALGELLQVIAGGRSQRSLAAACN
ncbi:MAG: succinoglycan biosynthesis protein ExoO [Chthoniobacter sp.]|jgi:glycosyltransferase involved in cell wall biosynthesis|nr:succinoglycan biosynthesis protein ExoO [Chthoniobacter sp.]